MTHSSRNAKELPSLDIAPTVMFGEKVPVKLYRISGTFSPANSVIDKSGYFNNKILRSLLQPRFIKPVPTVVNFAERMVLHLRGHNPAHVVLPDGNHGDILVKGPNRFLCIPCLFFPGDQG